MNLSIDTAALPHDAAMLVGFSGGRDSTALLHLLHATFPGQARAVHVHHGLHADADAWAAHCATFCASRGIPFEVLHVDVQTLRREHGLEGAARAARYAAFQHALQADEVLCTAHHQDDQAETLLLRLMRGSGVDGLAAMREWRKFGQHRHWRPLLQVPRAEIDAYCGAHGLHCIDDPSNARETHERNFLRHQVLPLLRQRWPQAAGSLAHSAALLAADADWLGEETQRLLARCGGLDDAVLDVVQLMRLQAAQRAHVLRRWARHNGAAALDSHALAAIERELLSARRDAEAQLQWRAHRIHRWRDALIIEPVREPWPQDWQADWHPASPLRLPCGRLLSLHAVDADAPSQLQARARRGGERLHQPGRMHSQELRKLFQASGIPPWERERLPLVFLDDELVAVGDVLRSAIADARGWFFRISRLDESN